MTDRRRNALTLTGSAAVLVLALTGCAGVQPASSTPTASATSDPTPAETPEQTPAESSATAVVRTYLDAIASGDSAAAWDLLTPEARSFYGDDAEVYATWFGRDGVTMPAEATALSDAGFVEADGPEGAFTLVSATTDTAADAWIVRETDSGPLVDDAGVPPTGSTVYEWRNPTSGGEDDLDTGDLDPGEPASLWFESPLVSGSTEPSTLGYPAAVWAYADGVEVPAEAGAASDAGRLFDVAPDALPTSAGPHALTIVWQIGDDSAGWRSTTTLLTTP